MPPLGEIAALYYAVTDSEKTQLIVMGPDGGNAVPTMLWTPERVDHRAAFEAQTITPSFVWRERRMTTVPRLRGRVLRRQVPTGVETFDHGKSAYEEVFTIESSTTAFQNPDQQTLLDPSVALDPVGDDGWKHARPAAVAESPFSFSTVTSPGMSSAERAPLTATNPVEEETVPMEKYLLPVQEALKSLQREDRILLREDLRYQLAQIQEHMDRRARSERAMKEQSPAAPGWPRPQRCRTGRRQRAAERNTNLITGAPTANLQGNMQDIPDITWTVTHQLGGGKKVTLAKADSPPISLAEMLQTLQYHLTASLRGGAATGRKAKRQQYHMEQLERKKGEC